MVKIKLYLKKRFRPIIIEIDSIRLLRELNQQLRTEDIIAFGPIIFSKNEFRYFTFEQKERNRK